MLPKPHLTGSRGAQNLGPDGEKLVGHQAPEPTFPVRYLNLSEAFKMGGGI